MRSLHVTGPGELAWLEVADPGECGPRDALVRPIAVSACDLDPLIVSGAWPSPYPLGLGHEFAGRVLAVGSAVESVSVGDRVAVPFQISCGECAYCARGLTANCAATPHRASWGFGEQGAGYPGVLAEAVLVPHADHMLVALPGGVALTAAASAGDNMADGYSMVAPGLNVWPDAEVLVVGGLGQSIGLYAAGLAVALGAARTVYLDLDEGRLECARSLGAEAVEGPAPKRAGSFHVTVDASGDPAGLACAVRSTAPDGFCSTGAGMLYRSVEVPVAGMYDRCCTFRTGRVHARPAMPALLELMAQGRFAALDVVDAIVGFDEAADALLEPHRKLVMVQDPAEAH